MDALEQVWLSGCGLAALLALAIITTVAAALQLRGVFRRRGVPLAPAERRAALGQAVMALAVAVAFWLLLAVAWLFRGIGHGPGMRWRP